MKYAILCLVLTFPAFAYKTVRLQEYLESFAKSDENLAVQRLYEAQTKNSYESLTHRFDLTSELSAYNKKADYEFPGASKYDLESNIFGGAITQDTPFGTQLKLEGDWNFSDHSEFSSDQENYSYSLTVSQPLFRNSFGSLYRKENQYLQQTFEAQKLRTNEEKINLCIKGVNQYLRAYLAKERFDIMTKIEKNSKDIWNYMEKSHKRKLVDKLSYLTAKADWFEKNRVIDIYRNNLKDNFSTLMIYAPISATTTLKSPFDLLDNLEVSKVDINNNYMLNSLKKNLKAKNANYQYMKDKNRSDISVFVKSGSSVTENDYSFSVAGDNEQKYVMAGITATLPLIQKRNDSYTKNALIDKTIAEKELSIYKKELMNKNIISRQDYELYIKQIDAIKAKLSVYEERAKVAFKKLKSGKIDLIDYISYRDAFSNESLNLLKAHEQAYEKKLNLVLESGVVPPFCEVL